MIGGRRAIGHPPIEAMSAHRTRVWIARLGHRTITRMKIHREAVYAVDTFPNDRSAPIKYFGRRLFRLST